MDNSKEEIIIKNSGRSGLFWPYNQGKKALSASSLTSILKEIEYKEKKIPEFILLIAAKNGKIFHQSIQSFFEKNKENNYPNDISKKTLAKVKESIKFFKEKNFSGFIGSENLYYNFYEGNFFATYIDLEFENFVIELKTNNVIINESPISMLVFKIQMLIQKICIGKDIYLFWSTGDGVSFSKFVESKELYEILKILVDIAENKDIYSLEIKKEIIKKLLEIYSKISSSQKFLIKNI